MGPRSDRNIRIHYLITDSNFGGTEASVGRLARGMMQRGYQISICSIKKPGYMAEEFKRQGMEFYSLNLPSNINWDYPFFLFFGLFRWRKILKREMPDIIHSFLFQSNLLASISSFPWAKVGSKKAVISSVRCINRDKSRWRIFLDRWALGKSKVILAVSRAVRLTYLEREKIQPAQIRVVYHGVERIFFEDRTDKLDLREKLGIQKQEYLIGTVARLHKDKGIVTLLESMALVVRSVPHIRLLIIGNGPEKDRLLKMARGLGIMNHVIFTGFQSHVIPWMASLDIFCLTSEEEGLPQSLLEAMALGKPVVVTRVGGVTEIINDPMCGILIPPGDPKALSNAVIDLLHRPEKAKKMGKAGRERIKRDFLLEHTLDQMEDIYRACL